MPELLRKFVIALFVVFLHYVPQITLWQEEDERYCDWWGLGHVAAIFVVAIVLAAAAVAIERLIRWSGPPLAKRLFDHAFLLALASGLLAAFPAFSSSHPWTVRLLWAAALVTIVGSIFWQRSPLVRWAAAVCLIFSPLVPILVMQMLSWPRWAETPNPLPHAVRSENGTAVVLLVFDEWSWLRSAPDGRLLPELKNMARLCEQSVVFQDAVSPHRDTMQSLPRLIFQTDHEFIIDRGKTFIRDDDTATPSPQVASLFSAARQAGYSTYLFGWFHPYRHVLGDQVDCCRSYFPGADRGFLFKAGDSLLANARYWSDPVSQTFGRAWLERQESEHWHAMGVRYREDMRELLRHMPAKGFAMFHVPSPHFPYVFNPDGSYHGPNADMHDTAGYLRQLEYADTLVGQIVEALRSAGRFDDAMLIVTSDHGWRFDPDPHFQQARDWDRRVPLVIKLPGQRTQHSIDRRFVTNRLQPLFEAVFAGKSKPEETLEAMTKHE